ncbi:hypothetical protein ACFFRR_007791, partial [Megaselia abdita]
MQKRWIIFFIFVVISGALCYQDLDFILSVECKDITAVHVSEKGKVSLMELSKVQQEITAMPKTDSSSKIAILALYAKETGRYICFNDKWRIIGKRKVDEKCYFKEKSKGGYRHFVSAVDETKVLAFTRRGKAIGPNMKVKHRCDAFFTLQKADTEYLLEEQQQEPKPKSNLSSEGNSRKNNPIEANSHKHKLRQGGHHKLRHNNRVHHRSMRSSSSSTTTTTTTTRTPTTTKTTAAANAPPPPMSSSSNSFHKSPSNIINSVLALRGVIPKKAASHRLRSSQSSSSQKPATTSSSQFLNPKDPKHYRDLQTQYYSSQEDAFHSPAEAAAAVADTDNNSSSNLSSRNSRSKSSNRLFSSNFEYSNDDEDDDANAKQNLPQNVHSIDNIYNTRSRNHNYNNNKSSRNSSSKRKHKNFLFRQKNNKNINFIPTY